MALVTHTWCKGMCDISDIGVKECVALVTHTWCRGMCGISDTHLV